MMPIELINTRGGKFKETYEEFTSYLFSQFKEKGYIITSKTYRIRAVDNVVTTIVDYHYTLNGENGVYTVQYATASMKDAIRILAMEEGTEIVLS